MTRIENYLEESKMKEELKKRAQAKRDKRQQQVYFWFAASLCLVVFAVFIAVIMTGLYLVIHHAY